MPPTPEAIVKERAARLRRAGEAALTAELNSRIGGETDVLIEQKDRGRASFYAAVVFTETGEVGGVRRMRLVGGNGPNLVGVPVE